MKKSISVKGVVLELEDFIDDRHLQSIIDCLLDPASNSYHRIINAKEIAYVCNFKELANYLNALHEYLKVISENSKLFDPWKHDDYRKYKQVLINALSTRKYPDVFINAIHEFI